MLRPQVLAIQDGTVKVGVIASERQAINAMLRRLAEDGKVAARFADVYWNARGGSYTDGGTFVYTLKDADAGVKRLECTDKFGRQVVVPSGQYHQAVSSHSGLALSASVGQQLQNLEQEHADRPSLFQYLGPLLESGEFDYVVGLVEELERLGSRGQGSFWFAVEALTMLYDRIYDTGEKRRASLLQVYDDALTRMFSSIPLLDGDHAHEFVRLDWASRKRLLPPLRIDNLLAVDALDFPVEGSESMARYLVDCYQKGWRRLVAFNLRGHRFIANGLGLGSAGLRLDCYGDVGDYVGSGVDGAELNVHGAAQDQVAQIMKSGKLVVHGDVGQAFMYAAKGGDVYVLGNAAGRPLINAVGRPRVVINGTCLDYLAESFMAGGPDNGGGVVGGYGFEAAHDGRVVEQGRPFPRGNLFFFVSGGGVYIWDSPRVGVPGQIDC